MGYYIRSKDLDLTRGCCSCPLKTGGHLCGRLDHNDDISEYVKNLSRPDFCPLIEVPDLQGTLVNLDTVRPHVAQIYHPELQRPGKPHRIYYHDDLMSASVKIKEATV